MDSSPQTDGFITSADGLITFITSPDPAGSRKDLTGSGGGCSADQAMPEHAGGPRRSDAVGVARRGHHALHLGVNGEQLPHGRLGRRAVGLGQGVDDPAVVRQGGLGRSVAAGDGAAGDLERRDDPGKVLGIRLPDTWMSSEWNSASAREKVSESPCAMASPMISTMSPRRCWTSWPYRRPGARRAARSSSAARSARAAGRRAAARRPAIR